MSDKEFNLQRKRIKTHLKHWRTILGLDSWTIRFEYHETRYEDNPARQADTDGSWQYQDATIRFFLPNIAEVDDDEVREIVVHELCHLLLDPIAHNIYRKEHEKIEFVTTQLSRAFLRTTL